MMSSPARRTLLLTYAIALSASVVRVGTCQCTLNEVQNLTQTDVEPNDAYGAAVAIHGTAIAVSSPLDDDVAQDSGAVTIYALNGTHYLPTQKLYPADIAASKRFGGAIAMTSTTIVVGAPEDDAVATNSGSVYVFDKLGAQWWQTAKLAPGALSTDDRFGYSVAIDANRLVVGTRGAGRQVYVFDRAVNQWSLTATLFATPHPASAVGVHGDRIVIGSALNFAANGRADIYELQNGAWVGVHSVSKPTSDFGFSCAIDGTAVIVGNPSHNNATGRAYIYEQVGQSWHESSVVGSDAGFQDGFGLVVKASAGRFCASTPYKSGKGAAYFFEKTGGAWTQVLKVVGASGIGNTDFGRSCDIYGDSAVVGAPTSGTGGQAFVVPATPNTAFAEFGTGCAGAGGYAPELRLSGCAASGGHLTLDIDSALGGSFAVLLFSFDALASPPAGPCPLLIGPVLPPVVIVPLFGAGPGVGAISLTGSLPIGLPKFELTVQAFIADPSFHFGYVATNGCSAAIN
jgi:hypothetical protein